MAPPGDSKSSYALQPEKLTRARAPVLLHINAALLNDGGEPGGRAHGASRRAFYRLPDDLGRSNLASDGARTPATLSVSRRCELSTSVPLGVILASFARSAEMCRSVYYQLVRQGRFGMVRRKGSARIEAGIASFVAGTRDLIAPWLAGFGFSQGRDRSVGGQQRSRSPTARDMSACPRTVIRAMRRVIPTLFSAKGTSSGRRSIGMVSRCGDWRGIKEIQRRPSTRSRLGLLFQILSSACERISRNTHWDFCEGMCPPSIV